MNLGKNLATTAPILAVTFDLGDTITDLGEGRGDYEARALQRAGRAYDVLAGTGLAPGERDAFAAALVQAIEERYHAFLAEQRGLQADAALRWYFERAGLALSADVLAQVTAAYCGANAGGGAPLRLGAVETLAALQARGLRLGVISNTIQPARFLDASLTARGLLDFFGVRVYSSEVGVSKPHPGIFQAALEGLGVPAGCAVHVGDRLGPDVHGAHCAGMRAILIEVPGRAESSPAVMPDARIHELPELLEVLGFG